MNRMVVSRHVRIHRQRQRSERPALLLGRCSQSSCTREPDTAPFNFFHQFQRVKARATRALGAGEEREEGRPYLCVPAHSSPMGERRRVQPTAQTRTRRQQHNGPARQPHAPTAARLKREERMRARSNP